MPNAVTRKPDLRLVAQSGVDYVKRAMKLGAGNKLRDVSSSFGGSVLCVLAQRSVTSTQASSGSEHFLRVLAGAAENTGCGNCGEQAAIAFIYLLDRNVRPLDYMALASPGDHAFVVVGRSAETDEHEPSTWKGAFVCDPWHGTVYDPIALSKLWGHRPKLIHRQD
jgi:hypothetical protein